MALKNPDHSDKELLRQYCGWVCQYKDLMSRLQQFDLISRHVRQHIREQGLCSTTGQEVEELLELVLKSSEFNLEACQFAGRLIDFLIE